MTTEYDDPDFYIEADYSGHCTTDIEIGAESWNHHMTFAQARALAGELLRLCDAAPKEPTKPGDVLTDDQGRKWTTGERIHPPAEGAKRECLHPEEKRARFNGELYCCDCGYSLAAIAARATTPKED